ncbi:Uncharacterized protein K02A2.6 [Eumeta japonica]|uniref:Uncharacterized protein K02A2.6 n=1 Tax=Eumeta variegata TaxID=151549 RepID=A0A4C1TWN2_EUMVA|nr:Uncharacterized protein K02A2.6 [Eumeta japonica]
MESIARNRVHWPGLDVEIEVLYRVCEPCRQKPDAPPHAPLTPWPLPAREWQRLHAKFAQCRSKRYLVVVDARTKCIEVSTTAATNARSVISGFLKWFARFGLPLQLVTDNGPTFVSYRWSTPLHHTTRFHQCVSITYPIPI